MGGPALVTAVENRRRGAQANLPCRRRRSDLANLYRPPRCTAARLVSAPCRSTRSDSAHQIPARPSVGGRAAQASIPSCRHWLFLVTSRHPRQFTVVCGRFFRRGLAREYGRAFGACSTLRDERRIEKRTNGASWRAGSNGSNGRRVRSDHRLRGVSWLRSNRHA